MTAPDSVVDDLLGRIAQAPAGLGGARLICIDGPAGSGKTTLAAQLGVALPAQVIHMDDLYPGWSGLAEGTARLSEWILEPLASGVPGRYRRYDWGLGTYVERHSVPLADFLVVEGCNSAALSVAQWQPFIIWVEADDEERLARGLARDGADAREHWTRWMEQEREFYAENRTLERAQVRLAGDGSVVDAGDL